MGKNLNALTMRISADTSGLSAGVKLTRSEIDRLNQLQRSSRVNSDKLRAATATLEKGFRKGAVSTEQLGKRLDSLIGRYGSVSSHADKFGDSIDRAKRQVSASGVSVSSLVASMRDLVTAKQQGAITADEFGQASARLKKQMKDLKDAAFAQTEEGKKQAAAAEESAKKFGRVQAAISKTIPETTRLAQQMRELRSEYAAGRISTDAFARANADLSVKYRAAKASSGVLTNAGRELSAQMRQLRADHRAGIIDTETFTHANSRLKQRLNEVAASTRNASTATKAATRNINEARASADSAASGYGNLASRIKALAVTYLGFQLARSAGTIALEIEQASIAFEVFTGSAKEGGKMLGELRSLAASTPLEFRGVSDAARTMMSFGVANKEVLPSLKQLGDISGGNAQRFGNLSLAFAQVAAAGKLMGQDLLQFVNAGFNPLQQIAETTGESMTDLRKRMSDGAISFKEVQAAMKTATGEGGRFFGMMDKFGGTASGSIAQLKSEFAELSSDIGSVALPIVAALATSLKDSIRFVREYASSFSELGAKLVMGNGAFLASLVIIPKLVGAIRGIVIAVRSWIAAQVTITALTGPKGWATIAASAVVAAGAVYGIDKAFEAHNSSLEAATEQMGEYSSAAQQLVSSSFTIADLAQPPVSSMEAYLQSIRDSNIELLHGSEYLAERRAMADGATAQQLEDLDMLKRRNAELKTTKETNDQIAQSIKDATEARKAEVNQMRKAGEQFAEAMKSPFDELVEKLTEIEAARRRGELSSSEALASAGAARADFKDDQKPVKVELPKASQRGSREEYAAVAEIFSGNRNREEQRHREAILAAKATETATQNVASAIERLSSTEPV